MGNKTADRLTEIANEISPDLTGLGYEISTHYYPSIAIGHSAVATNGNSIAIGLNAQAMEPQDLEWQQQHAILRATFGDELSRSVHEQMEQAILEALRNGPLP